MQVWFLYLLALGAGISVAGEYLKVDSRLAD